MTDLEVIEQYPFLLGDLRDCRKGDSHKKRAAELRLIRTERPLTDGLRRMAEWNYYRSHPQGFHLSRREFEHQYAEQAPSYVGIG